MLEIIVISLVSLLNWPLLNKYIYSKLNSSDDIKKITSEGLYHITSESAVNAIIETGYFKPSNFIASYGKRKVFFFAGIPSYNEVILNGIKDVDKQKLIAIKIKLTEEQIKNFKIRKYDDGVITYNGKLYIEQLDTAIAYLILDVNEYGQLYFKEVSKEEYYSHRPSKIVDKYINIRNFIKAYGYQYRITTYGTINLLKDIVKKFKLVKNNKYDNNRIIFGGKLKK